MIIHCPFFCCPRAWVRSYLSHLNVEITVRGCISTTYVIKPHHPSPTTRKSCCIRWPATSWVQFTIANTYCPEFVILFIVQILQLNNFHPLSQKILKTSESTCHNCICSIPSLKIINRERKLHHGN